MSGRQVGRRAFASVCPPTPEGLLDFDGLEVNAGVDGVQLTVQGVEGRPFGGFGCPAVHHDAVDVLRAAGWTWQPET